MSMSKAQEREFFAQVLAVVNRYDFCGLQPGAEDGAPIGEYEMESRPMESILVNRGRIEVDDIRAIWGKSFGDDLSERQSAVVAMAEELNDLVSRDPR
jgi:hypothetical protein